MAAQDGFANGMQMGLGLFNAMQNATYQQQILWQCGRESKSAATKLAPMQTIRPHHNSSNNGLHVTSLLFKLPKMGTDMVPMRTTR